MKLKFDGKAVYSGKQLLGEYDAGTFVPSKLLLEKPAGYQLEVDELLAQMTPPVTVDDLDLFALAYVEAMLWSTNDESDESGGQPMDSNYSVDDLDADLIAEIVADCKAFRAKFSDEFLKAACLGRYDAIEQAGHDFWLTRAGHGCGFWETSDWEAEAGGAMTQYCEEVGECYICIGDNGKVCI